jgi:hypothetical protein
LIPDENDELITKLEIQLSEKDTWDISPLYPLDIEIRLKVDGKIVRSDELISLRVIDIMDDEVMSNV